MNANLKYLKIKSKTLAAEARIIRKEEMKLQTFIQAASFSPSKVIPSLDDVRNNVKTQLASKGITDEKSIQRIMMKAETKWRRNIQAQKTFSRISGRNDLSDIVSSHDMTRESMYRHRKDVVRPEARATFIAIAYIRGIPYENVECGITDVAYSVCGITPPVYYNQFWGRVIELVKKYGAFSYREDVGRLVREWRDRSLSNQKVVEKLKTFHEGSVLT